jgi:hypothetical protein
MKKILFALTTLALVLPALPQARGQEVSVDFFYNNLSGGNWIEVADYGYGWQPDVAVNDPNWRPYADGYWAYTDDGWTWVSYEDFGWATYHYGRWARLADQGWVWFPGSDLDWGPAWVSWRTGGDYVGWAPLPPRGPGIAYEGQPIGGQVDLEFDIGPAYYNFIDARFIGEPVLRDRIFPPSQNVTYINNTVNVTNITVQNNVVYNYGPDYNALSARSSRPIQRLKIERQQNVDLSTAAKSGALTKVQGDKLFVGAPAKINKPARGIVPPNVKTKVAQPKIEKGWSGVSNEAQLKQKMKTENPKNIPPPTGAGIPGRAAGAASPVIGASPATSPAPFERGRGKGKPGGKPQPGATGAPTESPAGAVSPAPFERGKGKAGGRPQLGATGAPTESPAGAASPAPFERGKGKAGGRPQPGATGAPTESPAGAVPPAPFEKGKGKGKPGGKPQPGATGAPTESPAGAASPAFQGSPFGTERGKPGKGRRGELGTSPTPYVSPPGQTGAAPVAPEATQPPSKHKGQFERGNLTPSPSQPGGVSNAPEQGRYRGRGPAEQTGPSSSLPGGGPPETQAGKRKGQGAYGQPGAGPAGGSPAGVEQGQGKPAGGKKKREKGSPTPGPQ